MWYENVFARRYLLTVLTILAFMLFLEVFLKSAFQQNTCAYSYNPVIKWYSLEPNQKCIYVGNAREFAARIYVNSRGFNDVEHEFEKPAGVKRILLLGDSFIEALQVDSEKHIGRRLQKLLGQKYEVITLGISGIGGETEYSLLNAEGLKYKPDIVVLFFSFNDLRDNLQAPFFIYNNTAYSIPESQYAPPIKSLKAFLRHNLHSFAFFVDNTRKLMTRIKTAKAGEKIDEEVSFDRRIFLKNNSRDAQEAWQHEFNALKEIAELERQNGAYLYIFINPLRAQVDKSFMTDFTSNSNLRENDYNLTLPIEKIKLFGESINATVINPLQAFINATAAGSRLYWNYDGHWTEQGHAEAAKILKGALER